MVLVAVDSVLQTIHLDRPQGQRDNQRPVESRGSSERFPDSVLRAEQWSAAWRREKGEVDGSEQKGNKGH